MKSNKNSKNDLHTILLDSDSESESESIISNIESKSNTLFSYFCCCLLGGHRKIEPSDMVNYDIFDNKITLDKK